MKRLPLLAALLALPTVLYAQAAIWVGADTHKFQWNANPPGELVQGYRVYLEGKANGQAVITQSEVGLVTEVPISSFQLPQGTYLFWVTAYNPAGESHPSVTVPFVLALSAPGDPTGVSAPTGVRIEPITQP